MRKVKTPFQKRLTKAVIHTASAGAGGAGSIFLGQMIRPKDPTKTDFSALVQIGLGLVVSTAFNNEYIQTAGNSATSVGILRGINQILTTPKLVDLAGLGCACNQNLGCPGETCTCGGGMGCPDCGGTCGMKGLGGIENLNEFLTSSQLSEIRSRCPGLDTALSNALDQVRMQGKTATGIIYNATTCKGLVKYTEPATATTATNPATGSTGSGANPLVNAKEGEILAIGQCTDGKISIALVKKTTNGGISVGVPLINDNDAQITLFGATGNVLQNYIVPKNQEITLTRSNVFPDSSFYAEIRISGYAYTTRVFGACTAPMITSGSVEVAVTPPATTVPPAMSNFTYEVNSCSPVVKFFDKSLNTVSRRWDFGDGLTSTELNPVINLPSGTRSVKLTAYGADGKASDSYQTINVPVYKSKPEVSFQVSTQPGSRTVSFRSTVKNGVQYTWNFGDGKTDGSADPTHTYDSSGMKTVVLSVRNECGTTDYTLNINVPEVIPTTAPPVEEPCNVKAFVISNKSPYVGETVGLAVTNPQAGERYTWEFSDGTTAEGTTVTKTVTKVGQITVRLTTNCKNGGTPVSAETINVVPPPTTAPPTPPPPNFNDNDLSDPTCTMPEVIKPEGSVAPTYVLKNDNPPVIKSDDGGTIYTRVPDGYVKTSGGGGGGTYTPENWSTITSDPGIEFNPEPGNYHNRKKFLTNKTIQTQPTKCCNAKSKP